MPALDEIQDVPPIRSVSFTGPARSLSLAERRFIRETLRGVRAERYVTGGAFGVDTAVHRLAAEMYPDAEHLVIAPSAPWSRDSVAGAKVTVAPPGRNQAEAYMNRNDLLIAASQLLVAFPEGPAEVKRSGTWATVRRGWKAAGVEVEIHALSAAG